MVGSALAPRHASSSFATEGGARWKNVTVRRATTSSAKGSSARRSAVGQLSAATAAAAVVRDPAFRPTLGPNNTTFRMVDLLFFAFEGKAALLNPNGN